MRVLSVEHAEPRLNASGDGVERHRIEGDARCVPVFNAEFAERHGLDAGDRLELCREE
ncbi:MAG: hypothetical protein MAG715_00529 [Methanonatronarchaeales archaeon]|nr:hypothetical protein [Methanonatronarchaeales archaeon]